MIFLTMALAIFLLVLVGRVVLFLMMPSLSVSRWMTWGLSYLLGSGALTLWMFFIGTLGFKLSVNTINILWIIIVSFLWLRRKDLQREKALSKAGELSDNLDLLCWILGIYIWVIVFFVSVGSLMVPIFQWDPMSAIAFNGKVLFWERSFEFNRNLAHPSYPLHIPLLEAGTSIMVGIWDGRALKLIFLTYFFSFLMLQYGFLKQFFSRRISLFGVSMTLSSGYLCLQAANGYMDAALMAYISSAFFILLLAVQKQRNSLYLLAGLLAGMAGFVKPEGAYYAGLLMCILVLMLSSDLKSNKMTGFLKKCFVFIFPATVIIAYYKIYNALIGIVPYAHKQFFFKVEFLGRIKEVLAYLLYNLFATFNWGMSWLLFAFCLFFVFRWRHSFERWIFLSIMLFFMAICAGICFTDSYQYVFPDDVVFSRLLLHFYPLVPVFCTFCLASVFEKEKR